jgi:cell fate (sporulation/competence/biofilm development) regulator YlbF (YheA/YmcA/DUF963 family)
MTIQNETLAKMINTLGEVKTLDLLRKKIEDDEARREYHKKYNAKKNELFRRVKMEHPELFKVN